MLARRQPRDLVSRLVDHASFSQRSTFSLWVRVPSTGKMWSCATDRTHRPNWRLVPAGACWHSAFRWLALIPLSSAVRS